MDMMEVQQFPLVECEVMSGTLHMYAIRFYHVLYKLQLVYVKQHMFPDGEYLDHYLKRITQNLNQQKGLST